MTNRQLRWAVIGAGGMGRWHVEALLKRQDVAVAACCDINPQALSDLPPDVLRFDDWKRLVQEVQLDAATVILPHYLYPQVVTALLQAGVHVMKEKPFARDLDGALMMCRAARDSGKRLVVAGQHKFEAPYLAAQRHVPELGDIFLARASILYRADSIVDEGKWAWRGIHTQSGGVAIIDSGWHILELLTLMRGLPSRVCACTGTMRISNGEFDVDEQGGLLLQYPDGGLGVVVTSFVTAPGELRLVLYGKRASLDIDFGPNKVTFLEGGKLSDVPVLSGEDAAQMMYDAFIQSIENNSLFPGTWEQAVHVQRIIEAAYLSAERGGAPVELPEVSLGQ